MTKEQELACRAAELEAKEKYREAGKVWDEWLALINRKRPADTEVPTEGR